MAEKAFNTMARLNFGAWALAGIAVIAVSGCGDIRVGPAGRTQQAATAQQPCDRDMSGARTVYVCLGDTLSGLARLKNVTVANLMKANGLSDDQIQAGSTLVLPDEYVHVVQPGETVLGISRQTNVSSDAIIAANDLTNAGKPGSPGEHSAISFPTHNGVGECSTTVACVADSSSTNTGCILPEKNIPILLFAVAD